MTDIQLRGRGVFLVIIILVILLVWGMLLKNTPLVRATNGVVIQERVYQPQEELNFDISSAYVDESLNEFIPKKYHSEARMIMHCLLHRESRHGDSGKPTDPHGDGGRAGGPLQFHEGTWIRMRGQMKAQGIEVDDSTRYDLKESIRTTVWAIQNGRAKEWGPALRYSEGSNFAACQTPSWVK